MGDEIVHHVPFPPPSLLGLNVVEWAVLVRLSEACRATVSGMSKISLRTIAIDLCLRIDVVHRSMCRLHDLKYVALADHAGNQYIDRDVLLSVGRNDILDHAAETQHRMAKIREPNIKPRRDGELAPSVSATQIKLPKSATKTKTATSVRALDLEPEF